MIKVNIGDQRNFYLGLYWRDGLGSRRIGHRHSNNLAPCRFQSVNLFNGGGNILGGGVGHGLHGYGRAVAHRHTGQCDPFGFASFDFPNHGPVCTVLRHPAKWIEPFFLTDGGGLHMPIVYFGILRKAEQFGLNI